MSDKSFEQQVKEELSDLRIKPDAAVWESVSASLQKERKRRWAIWLLVLLVGLTSAGFWWTLQGEVIEKGPAKALSQQQSTISSQNQKSEKESSTQQQVRSSESSELSIGQTEKNLTTSTNSLRIQKYNSANGDRKKVEDDKKSLADITMKSTSEISSDVKQNAIQADLKKGESVKVDEKISSTTTLKNIITNSLNLDSSLMQKDRANLSDTTVQETQQPETINLVIDSIQKTTIRNKKKNVWQWRIGVTTGISGVRNSLTSLFEGTNKSAYSEAIGRNFSPTTPGGSLGNNMPNRPVVRDAFSFGLSIEVFKKIGKRERDNIGITAGYNLYKTTTGIGTQNIGTIQFANIDFTNVNNTYYNIKDSSSYTSSYHFLHLGVQYSHTLKWLKKVDMKWFAGTGVNFLVNTNGLHLGYDSTGTYLFQNTALFRRVQLDISTGLQFSLGKKKQVQLAPHVQYMLTNLSKQQGVNQHLFRPALRLSFSLRKKN